MKNASGTHDKSGWQTFITESPQISSVTITRFSVETLGAMSWEAPEKNPRKAIVNNYFRMCMVLRQIRDFN